MGLGNEDKASEDKTTASRPVPDVQVAVIGTGDTKKLVSGTEATTPNAHQPNIVVNVVTPIFALIIRFINVFLPVFSGVLLGALGTGLIPANDFLHLVYKCAGLSLSGTAVAFIKDLITIFGKLEQKYPILTGNV